MLLENTRIPPGSLVAGVPAKVRRELTVAERRSIAANARAYRDLAVRVEVVLARSSRRDGVKNRRDGATWRGGAPRDMARLRPPGTVAV